MERSNILDYPRRMRTIADIVESARQSMGSALRSLRESRRLTQAGLAERLGVNHTTVSHRERASSAATLTLDALVAHADALGAHLRVELVDGAGDTEVQIGAAVPPELAELCAAWGQLDDGARSLILASAHMALRTVREPSSNDQKLVNIR